jgi:serine/threonine protein kinase
MAAQESRVPTTAELQAFCLGKLEFQRESEVESYLAEHPECAAILDATPDDEMVRPLRGAGELPRPRARARLLELAVEAVVPVLGGCAGVVAGGVAGGMAGVVVGQLAEKGINFFGQRIVEKWQEWLRRQPRSLQVAALTQLADVLPEVARGEVTATLERQAPQVSAADRQAAIDYLSSIPRSVRRSLLSDRERGTRALPPTVSLDNTLSLLPLLPASAPPYPALAALPGTDYKLEELIGTGGFGAVYRASSPSLQYLPLAIKFCLDRSLLPGLQQERANLERLMKAGGEAWSTRLVRLYGYDLEHPTPYLVYEYVPGGDLVHRLAQRQTQEGRGLTADEVLRLIVQVAEALAFAHERGLVHRDLKPANVLIGEGTIKLADFGIGTLVAQQAVQGSRIGTVAASRLSPAEQASLFRGAGTPLYMSQEQRRGDPPEPHQDVYSLGVMWYQMLAGDVSRELHPGWDRELGVKFGTPPEQIEVIRRCVGWIEDRPRDAAELLQHLRPLVEQTDQAVPLETPRTQSAPRPATTLSSPLLLARLRQLPEYHQAVLRPQLSLGQIAMAIPVGLLAGLLGAYLIGGAAFVILQQIGAAPAGVAAPIATTLGLPVGICLLIGAIWLWLRISWHNARESAVRQRDTMITELAAAFPQEVASWGGPAVLRDPKAVREVLQQLEASSREGSQTRLPAAGEQVKSRFALRLGQLLERHDALAAARHRGNWIVATWALVGTTPAVILGLAASDHNRQNEVGLLAGLVIEGAFILLGLGLRRKAVAQAETALAGRIEALLTEFPHECQTWGGRAALADREMVDEILRELDWPSG